MHLSCVALRFKQAVAGQTILDAATESPGTSGSLARALPVLRTLRGKRPRKGLRSLGTDVRHLGLLTALEDVRVQHRTQQQ